MTRAAATADRDSALHAPARPALSKRVSGILLHPTSLPGRFGLGELGPEAFRFLDFLAAAQQQLWQVLPLGPTGYGDSPYQCFSAFGVENVPHPSGRSCLSTTLPIPSRNHSGCSAAGSA